MRLLAEKIPLLLLGSIAAVLAVVSQQDWGALNSTATLSLTLRSENAVVSYARYLRRIFWPNDLAIFYPHPADTLTALQVALAAVVLVALAAVAVRLARRAPYLLVGLLWFGIVLGPVIGLIQIGGQGMADRYAYTSTVGIFVALVWAAAEWLPGWKPGLRAAAAAAVTSLALCAAWQVLFWRDSETVFTRAAAVTKDNAMAHLNLGCNYFDKGNNVAARRDFLQALEIQPENTMLWNNLANVDRVSGDVNTAIQEYARALQYDPDNRQSILYLGRILAAHGKKADAERLFKHLHQLADFIPEPLVELGKLYADEGRWPEAVATWNDIVKLYPDDHYGQVHLAEAEAALKRSAPTGEVKADGKSSFTAGAHRARHFRFMKEAPPLCFAT